jgi:hypothetical protein
MSRRISTILGILLVASFVLTACGAPATPAPAAPKESVADYRVSGKGDAR